MVVVGMLVGGGFTAYKNSNPQLKSDLKKIRKIQESMQSFFNTNGRLPYPAYYKDDKDGENYLKENLTNIKEIKTSPTNINQQENQTINNKVLFGVVPTRTLGLSDDYAYDSYGKNIEYVVNSSLTEKFGDENNEYKKSDYNVNKQGQYVVSYTNTTNEKDIITIMPNLSIHSIKTNKITKNAGYILMSKQKQKKCFISIKSNTFEENLPNDNAKIQNNCFVNEIIERFYQGYNKDFDEIVVFKSLNDMIYSMSNENESVNEMTQGNIIQYQPRISKKLETEKKDVISAINEVNQKFQIVKVLDKAQGQEDVLYYLTKDTEEYNAGLYVWDTETGDFESVGGGGAGDGTPVGTIIAYGGKEIPYGYLLCGGQILKASNYPELFRAIGYSYGGDGTATFALPDLNHRFLEGTVLDDEVGQKVAPGLPNIEGVFSFTHPLNAFSSGDGMLFSTDTNVTYSAALNYTYYQSVSDRPGMRFFFNASKSNPIYGASSTVQPASLRVKYLIKYTKKQKKKEGENALPDPSQLSLEDIKFICEAMYPVGSVYINYVTPTPPQDLLFCGKWEPVTPNYYLMSVNPKQNNTDYDAYNNRYGNYANEYLGECLPNLEGRIGDRVMTHGENDSYRTGVFKNSSWHGKLENMLRGLGANDGFGKYYIFFNASTSNPIYKSNCNKNMPFSYGVYIWRRTG